jgi:hypothetical protein
VSCWCWLNSIFAWKLLPTPPSNSKGSISQWQSDCGLELDHSKQMGRVHCIGSKNEALLPAPPACCARVPAQPSAEINFALPRQFSIPVSLIMTPVVLFLTPGVFADANRVYFLHSKSWCLWDSPPNPAVDRMQG